MTVHLGHSVRADDGNLDKLTEKEVAEIDAKGAQFTRGHPH